MLGLFRTSTAKPEEAKGENKGEAPAADGEEAKVRTRSLVAGGKAKKSPILTRSRAAKGEEVVCGNPPSVTY